LRNILGLDETGETHPLEAYDIGCDEGAWNHVTRKMWCAAQALPFALGKWSVGVGIDLMGWALEFRLADALTPLGGLLSQVYDTSLVGPLGIRHLAWTLALLVAGWHLMRAHTARGIGEIATTFAVATVGAVVLANPQGYLEGSVSLAQNTSGSVLEAIADTLQTSGHSEQGSEAVRRRLGEILRRSFVAEPYDLINWGRQLSGDCAAARDEILDDGPWASDDEPRDIMRDHGCDAEADFNHDPTDSRAAASLIVGLAAIVATVLLVAVALVVFVAQLTLVALFAGASLIWALALFPGGREVLWWWVSRLAWAVTATIAATFTLSWLAVTVTAALTASDDMSIVQRSLVALLVVAFGFRLRAHLGRMIDQASRRFGASLNQLGRHAQNRWAGLAAGGSGMAGGRGGSGGFGLSTAARDWSLDFPGGQYMWNRLYSRHFTRGYRRSGYPGFTSRTLHRADAAGQRLTHIGGTAGRTAGRAARAVVLAPVLGPQAYTATRVRASAASTRARSRLQQARATRQQWLHNTRHPMQAMQDAHGRTTPAAGRRPSSRPTGGRPSAAAPAGRRDSPAGWWAVGATPYRQPELGFTSRPVTYEQQQLDLDDRRSRSPRPRSRRRPEPYVQPELDFGGWQQQFDLRPPERRRPVERPAAPRARPGPDARGESPGGDGKR
jgi:hypothetical protein